MRRRRAIVTLLALALCAAACQQTPVSEAEREMLLRADDLAAYGFELPEARAHESFTKTVYFDGSADVEYEFEPPDSALYMSVTVTFEKQVSDALISKGIEKSALQVGIGIGGLKLEEKRDFFGYGDESSFYTLTKDGRPVGNFFITREGAKVYSIVIVGAYFEDSEEWAALVTPRLQKFSAHKP